MTWHRQDDKTIIDGHVVRYKYGTRSEISASRNAVMVSGYWSFYGLDDMEKFEHVLNAAWRQHTQLKHNNHQPLKEQLFTKCCDAILKHFRAIPYCDKCGTSDTKRHKA